MELVAADIFAGAGGLSLGAEAAGVTLAFAAEWDDDAADTLQGQHPGLRVVRGDIAELDYRPWRGDIDLLVGGPPCQPFSTGGKRLAAEDPRNGFPQYVRALKELSPQAFVLENVAGVVAGGRRSYWDGIVSAIERLGYEVTWSVLNAADYGVPQSRKRLVALGCRSGVVRLPDPTHGPGRRPYETAGSVVDPVRPMGPANPSIVTYAKRPDPRVSPYAGHLWNGGGRPIDLSKPSPTLLASMGGNKTPWVDPQGIVPEYHAHLIAGGEPRSGRVPGARRITIREAAALQTFDSDLGFAGSRSSQYRQIGNAVPPLLAKTVVESLARQL